MSVSQRELLTGLPMISAAAFFIQMLDATILNTALPTIASDMGRSPFSMQLAVISYTLTVALLIPLSGWLADRFGTRGIFLGSVLIFIVGSISCAASSSLEWMVMSRIVQGIGGAMMVPVARLTLMRAFSRDDFVQVFTFITIPGLIGPVVGPILGGWMVTYASWHWVFLINVPIGILGIWGALRSFPDFRQSRGKFDIKGFLFIGIGVLALTLGLEWIGGKSASLSVAIVLLTVGFFCIIIYIFHAQRCEAPLIRLEVFRVRTFAIGIAGNMVARLGIGSIPFLVPLMVQVGLGYSADIAGMLLIAPAVGSLMTKTVVLRVLGRFGYRNTLLCLTLSIACIFACMGIQQPTWPISLLVIHLFVQGILMSGQFSAMNTITLGDLSNELASDGNSLLSVAQNLCQSFGVAISTVLLRLFSDSGSDLDALHATFFAVACITATSALVFMLLRPHDGSHLLKDSHSRQRHGE